MALSSVIGFLMWLVAVCPGLCQQPADVSTGKPLRQEAPGAIRYRRGPLRQPGKSLGLALKVEEGSAGAFDSVVLQFGFKLVGSRLSPRLQTAEHAPEEVPLCSHDGSHRHCQPQGAEGHSEPARDAETTSVSCLFVVKSEKC